MRHSIFQILILSMILFSLLACTEGKDETTSNPGPDSDNNKKNLLLESDIDPSLPTIGIRNFRQMYAMIYAVLELTNESNVDDYYDENASSFSIDGSVTEISATLLLKTVEFVSVGCNRFVRRERQDPITNVFDGIDLGRSPSEINIDRRKQVILRLALRFWRRAPQGNEEQELLSTMSAIEADAGNDARIVMTGVCSVIGASTDSIILL